MRIIAANNFGDTVPGGLAGPMGLLMVVLLGIATALLIRNMNSRLRRLPASFEDPGAATTEEPEAGGGSSGRTGGSGGAERPTGDGDER